MSPPALSGGTAWPIDVSVRHNRGQRRLRTTVRPSLFGAGLLERARATSLALLGATAAVGLAIVAIALNQGWPLIAGSAIPRPPPQHQGLGGAAVASRPGAGHSAPRGAGVQAGSSRRRAGPARHAGAVGAGPVAVPDASSELVVSPSRPARSRGGESHGSPVPHGQTPVTQHPVDSPTAAVPPPPQSEPASPPQPAPAAAPQPPIATTSEAPAGESSVPSWSRGNGHAYGRSDGWEDHGGGSGGYGDDSHGRHYGD
jgi:hypothetical protein